MSPVVRGGVPSMPVPVVPLPRQEWRAAGLMLARAFADDPVRVAMFPNPERRQAQLEVHFTTGLRQLLLARQVVETTPARSGVAVWGPPDQGPWPLTLAALRTAPFDLIQYLRAGITIGEYRRMLAMLLHYNALHRELLPQPHWYLTMLGVDPAVQGYGTGAVLVLHGLARADRDALPAYVETETAANATFYGKFGFQTVRHVAPSEHPYGVPLWCMVRPAGAAVQVRYRPSPGGALAAQSEAGARRGSTAPPRH